MTLRVVLDTNVVVSAALAPGPPAVCVELALVGVIELLASKDLLAEYAAVLARPRFALPTKLVQDYLTELRTLATIVTPAPVPARLTHRGDAHVLACAVGGRANVLVTGNIRHFPTHYRQTRVLRPAEFLAELITG